MLFTLTSKSQIADALSQASLPAELNSNGDPITQIIDPNGAKQGSWSYADVNGKLFLEETYSDNQCTQRVLRFMLEGHTEVLQMPSEEITPAEQSISSQLGTLCGADPSLQTSSYAVICDDSGLIVDVIAFGTWQQGMPEKLEQVLQDKKLDLATQPSNSSDHAVLFIL